MKKPCGLVALIVGWIACGGGGASAGQPLPRSAPEEQGVSSSAIRSFVEKADQSIDSLHSVMLVRHGKVVAEGWWAPYDAETKHQLFSLSKSFTSTAVGLAVDEGKLSINDPVLKFFPEDAPEDPSDNLKAMQVSDLLRMSTGHQEEPKRPDDQVWTKAFLSQPVPFKPGTHFLYNTSGSYMLSAIVQKATGETTLDYLRPRLFEPLGIDDPEWGESPQGVSLGGYGLNLRTEDIAKFGHLYLRKGMWNGERVLPEAWVEAATSLQTSNGSNPESDWDQGYGYQFWRARHGAYRGDGAFGQYCVVMPEQDAVVAITAGVGDMQAVLNLIWDELLPGFKPSTLPADSAAQAKLAQALKGLMIRCPEGSEAPGAGLDPIGKTYRFAENPRKLESVALEKGEADATTLVIRSERGEQRIECGRGSWTKGRVGFAGLPPQPAAVAGAWTADDVFTAKIAFVETPFIVTLRLKFQGDQVTLASETNIGFGPTRQGELVGEVE